VGSCNSGDTRFAVNAVVCSDDPVENALVHDEGAVISPEMCASGKFSSR